MMHIHVVVNRQLSKVSTDQYYMTLSRAQLLVDLFALVTGLLSEVNDKFISGSFAFSLG